MKTNIIIAICAIGLCLFTSCNKENIASDYESIFNVLWTDFNENYAVFEARNVDWQAAYDTFHPQAVNANSEEELWDVVIHCLDVLYDPHVSIWRPDGTDFESGSLSEGDSVRYEFSREILVNYLETEPQQVLPIDDILVYSKVKDKNIGYLHFRNFDDETNTKWAEEIERIITEFENTDGIIIDIRNNSGGDDVTAHRIARAFAANEAFAYTRQTKNGPGPNDFDTPTEYYVIPEGTIQYTKPILVLINSYTTSGAEVFGLYLETQEHVEFMGINTATGFSDVSFERFLPNGWAYLFSHQLYLYPDGVTSPEGVGIIPDIQIRNTPADVTNGIDEVLENAIEYFN